MINKSLVTLIILFISLLFLSSGSVFASSSNGSLSGYAFGNNTGWINFGCSQCGVQVTDSGLTGYGWSDNYGWIKLNPTNSGVANNNEGTLSGKAWGEGIGWINFSGVAIGSSGAFSGTASVDSGGTINFSCTNCSVATDWRSLSSRTPPPSGGGGSGGGNIDGPFSVLINNGSRYTNNQVVKLNLDGGLDATEMAVSNTSDFLNADKEKYQKIKLWTLSKTDGPKTVYVKFYNKYGLASNLVSSNIILDTVPPEIKITSIKNQYNSNRHKQR